MHAAIPAGLLSFSGELVNPSNCPDCCQKFVAHSAADVALTVCWLRVQQDSRVEGQARSSLRPEVAVEGGGPGELVKLEAMFEGDAPGALPKVALTGPAHKHHSAASSLLSLQCDRP